MLILVPAAMHSQQHCGRDAMTMDKDWKLQRVAMEEQLQAQWQNESIPRNGPITISVVFHQLATDENDFLSNLDFENQIRVLNEDFGNFSPYNDGTPFELQNAPVDMGLRFCIATMNPAGEMALGIERKLTNYNCIGDFGSVVNNEGKPRIYYSEEGGLDAWDTRFYLNIWVAPTCDAFLGFATFPEEGDAAQDGVIIDTKYFGLRSENSASYPYHLGRVCTHEVGHYFNLSHLWGEGGCDTDDFVSDTPSQESFHIGCPVHPNMSCESADYFFNFMDYSDDACLSMFTAGQRQRALASLYEFRADLLESAACSSWGPGPNESNVQIFPNPTSDLLYLVPPSNWPKPIPYRIYNELGQLVQVGELTNSPLAINVAPLLSGIYFLNLENGDTTIIKKFLAIR